MAKNLQKRLVNFYKSQIPIKPFYWLQGRSFSDAFVICIGAGPWKFGRRKKIQGDALEKLAGRDLSELSKEEASTFYPLKWQNNLLNKTVLNLQKKQTTFENWCCNDVNVEQVRELCGAAGKPKVISLFCRDALKSPSFPIDRHVKRKLVELGLPTDEDAMVKLCNDAKVDSSLVAIAFVRAASNMDNPDWSYK